MEDTKEYFEILGIKRVPILHDGAFDMDIIRDIEKELDTNKDEGYVIRVADSFTYAQFKTSVAKYVRANHVQTTRHWRAGRSFTPNGLAK